MRLSIVIPTLGRPVLDETLSRLERQVDRSADFEVLLVRDPQGGDPGAVERAAAGRALALRLLTATSSGASAARNAGWREASGPIVLFLGDDILAAPRLVAEHLEWHEREPAANVGVLGHVRWASRLAVTPFMRWLEQGIQFDFGSIDGSTGGWGHFYTANASVKRDLLERMGGFDERLPFLYEDLDLALRVDREAGFRLLYNRRAEGEHLHPPTIDEWRARMALVARAERRFVALHPEVPPYFHDLLEEAARREPARGRLLPVAHRIPRWVPWLGPRARFTTDLYFRQQLAPSFLEAWAAAGPPATAGR